MSLLKACAFWNIPYSESALLISHCEMSPSKVVLFKNTWVKSVTLLTSHMGIAPNPELSPQMVHSPVTGCSARQLPICPSNVAFELGIGVTGVTPSYRNCPAAGVAKKVKTANNRAMKCFE